MCSLKNIKSQFREETVSLGRLADTVRLELLDDVILKAHEQKKNMNKRET
jgi:hypothetical protein